MLHAQWCRSGIRDWLWTDCVAAAFPAASPPSPSRLRQRNLGKMLLLGLTFILYMVFGMVAMKVVSMCVGQTNKIIELSACAFFAPALPLTWPAHTGPSD